MTNAELLKRYDAMWLLSRQMLESAKSGEWELLVEIEQARSAITEKLKQEDTVVWKVPDSDKKAKLIRAILAADAEIKTLTEFWMKGLQGMIGSVNTEIKLKKAYESP